MLPIWYSACPIRRKSKKKVESDSDSDDSNDSDSDDSDEKAKKKRRAAKKANLAAKTLPAPTQTSVVI